MNRSLYISLLVLLNILPAVASPQDSLSVQIDNDPITVKQFEGDLSEKYQGSEFEYETSLEGESENFIARALRWVLNQLSETFGFDVDPVTYEIVEFVFYGILIILALYFVIRLLVGKKATAFFSKSSSTLAPLNIQEEHIESVDLDQFIKDALAQNNYRLAIRYMYLKALKELSFRNLISWDYDKTNLDYYREIENPNLKDNFKKVSYLYDYVWYGEFDIDAQGFANARADFERFTKNMSNAG